jgi:zinc transport system permease protein
MHEMLSLPFMQRALIAGLIVGVLASYYGVFVVQRGLSFLGDGLAHAAFGGVALAVLLGAEPLWVALPFTIGVALSIVWVQRRTRIRGDTAIGIFFATSMALGIIFLSLRRTNASDPMAYLFGSLLAVTRQDLWAALGLAALTAAAWPLWGRWAYATFDRELALADRLGVGRDDYLLAALLATVIVVAVKVVGIVLIASFLVIPAATARQCARTFLRMTLGAMAIGAASVLAGLWASWHLDLPSGPVVILLQAALFFAVSVIRR